MDEVKSKQLAVVAMAVAVCAPWFGGAREPIAVLLDFFILVLGFFFVWRQPKVNLMKTDWLFWAVCAWFGWGALSLVWSVNRYQTVVWLLDAGILIGSFWLGTQLHERKLSRWWMAGYLALASLFALYGFYLFLGGSYNRLISSFYLANPAAGYLLPAVILGGWWWTDGKSRWALAATALSGGALILTDSRGAWLSLVLVVLVASWFLRGRSSHFWVRLASVVLLAATVAGAVVAAKHYVLHETTTLPGARIAVPSQQDQSSISERLNFLRSTAEIWKDFPVLGTGAGTFSSVHPKYQVDVVSAATNAHNYYAQTLAEQGTIGGVLLIAVLAALAFGLWRGGRNEPWRWAFAAATLAMLIHLGLDIDSEFPAILALLGVTASFAYRQGEPVAFKKALHPAWILPLVLVAVWPARDMFISDARYQNGETAQNSGDVFSAMDYFAQAHQGFFYDPVVLTAEGIDRYTMRKLDPAQLSKAESIAKIARSQSIMDAQNYFLLARIARAQGDNKKAEQYYQQTLRLDPYDQPDYYNDLADLWMTDGRNAQAKDLLNQVIKLYPPGVVANRSFDKDILRQISNSYLLRGMIEQQADDVSAAKADLTQAGSYNPDDVLAEQLLQQLPKVK